MRDDKSEIVGGGKPPALEHMTEAEAVRFGVALCDALLQTAAARRAGRRADDCSVLAARIDRAGA